MTALSGNPAVDALTLAEAARIMRDATRDKSYQLLPLGADAAEYLRIKRKRLTKTSHIAWESSLDKLARHFADLELEDFEPPIGTQRIEEYLDRHWGDAAPRTYNKHLSITKDFFRWAILRGRLHGDPTLGIEPARNRQPHRTTFTPAQRQAIIASQTDVRDKLALRLLLDYGLRRGALMAVQFMHFDHWRKRLTVFSKGGTVRELPIPQPAFWHELEQHMLEVEARPEHYLLPKVISNQWATRTVPDQPLGGHGMHRWWYRCLANAGVVPTGVERGERMHKARHTAGQRVLDATGNLKATQKLLGHASIRTTGDIYTEWDADQLAATLADMFDAEDDS
jgi:site-specific recombinase XerC